MRRLLVIAAAVGGVLLTCGGAVGSRQAEAAREKLRAAQTRALADWRAVEPAVRADTRAFVDHPLLAPRDGGDAAPALSAHLRWDGDGQPAPVAKELLSSDGGWVLAPATGLEAGWLSGLEQYGYWEPVPPNDPPFAALMEPTPHYADLQLYAKALLVRGLAAGDARAAARQVRELARLLMTTQTLIGEMVGLALLGIERLAFDEASRRGQQVFGWAPVPAADVEALKRLLWAAPAPHGIVATGALADAALPVGYCAGLGEGLLLAHYLRGYLEAELPERYASLDRALREGPCRLSRVRRAWTSRSTQGQLPVSGRAFCLGDDGQPRATCAVPDFAMSLPYARPFVGSTLAVIASPDWLRRYRDAR